MNTAAPGFARHRPTVIQYIQWTPGNWPRLRMWLDASLGRGKYHHTDSHLVIETREGDRDCYPGYYIVREPGGFTGFYCIHPDLFPVLYELSTPTGYLPRHASTVLARLWPDQPREATS